MEYHECDLSHTPQLIADYYTNSSTKSVPVDNGSNKRDADTCSGVGVLGVHACGFATDAILACAKEEHAAVALMPCCYTGKAAGAPLGVRRALGVAAAADIGRSYTLQVYLLPTVVP